MDHISETDLDMYDRRMVVSRALGLAAVGLTMDVSEAQPSGMMAGMGSGAMTIQDCVDSCLRSHAMCLETARYCIDQGGRHVSAAHLALLQDCAEMCQTTANSLLRHSPQHVAVCTACAQLCDACAVDCLTFPDDPQMERCARTCKDCSRSCRDMAKMPQ
jgi:hypothetical protein